MEFWDPAGNQVVSTNVVLVRCFEFSSSLVLATNLIIFSFSLILF